jgi:CRISPR type III-B/RAMP module RAMP protein Cmr1
VRIQKRKWEPVTLTVTTPMFVGRDTTRLAEFRVPSLRGVLRYWFRFLAGPLVGHDIGRLAAAESRVFGDTDTSSPITIRLQEPVTGKLLAEPAWLPQGGGRQPDLRYLLGPGLQKYHKDNRKNLLIRAFLDRGTLIHLDFDFGPFRDLMLPVLWYAQTFGGIGARTRRGWGGFRLDLKWPWKDTVESRGDVQEEYGNVFVTNDGCVAQDISIQAPEYTPFPSVGAWDVFYLKEGPFRGPKAWETALNEAAKWLRTGRAPVVRGPAGRAAPDDEDRVTLEYKKIAWPFWKERLKENTEFDLGGFGLPLILHHGHGASQKRATISPYLAGRRLRRASMVSLRAIETGAGFTPLIAIARSSLLPDDAEIRITDGERQVALWWDTGKSITRLLE